MIGFNKFTEVLVRNVLLLNVQQDLISGSAALHPSETGRCSRPLHLQIIVVNITFSFSGVPRDCSDLVFISPFLREV